MTPEQRLREKLRKIEALFAGSATAEMIQQAGPSDREVLAGLVTFHNAESGFCVLRVKARGHRDQITVIGHAATITAGG